ncbi:MAG: SLBB domain-containing protein, partial [Treponema sp.]|nr:SLBB domain-containing protein [Treponema sp.]
MKKTGSSIFIKRRVFKPSFFIAAVMFAAISFSVSAEDALEDYSAINSIASNDFSNTVQVAMSNADYMVTAGDIYSLTYSANGIPVSYTIPVDPTYKIRVSNLAILDASGKSYLTLKQQVEEIVQKNYPMSGVQFVLLNPASFKVVIKGEVSSVVEKQAWALTRLSDMVAGTTTSYSSIRDVTVTSQNGKKRTYDLFKARRFGDLSQNPFVRPGDVITINRIARVVSITGAVERPGKYELMKGENLKTLVSYYGNGLTELADTSRIELVRNRENMDEGGEKRYLSQSNIDDDFALLNGDVITIHSKASLLPYIVIEGIINLSDTATANQIADDSMAAKDIMRRRTVKFYDGENYGTFVRRYKGLFNSYSDLLNAYIERDGKKIPLNLEEIIEDETFMSEYLVQRDDKLVVPFMQHFVNVMINGEVNTVREEGAWPLRRLSTVLEGNLTAYSSTRDVIVTSVDGKETHYDLFKASRDGDLEQNPYIRAGETVTVLRMERKVTIGGSVERPGTYEIKSGEGLKDLVEYYGHGLAELADTSRIELVRSRDNMEMGGEKIYLTQKDIDNNFELLNRDSIVIESKASLLPYIVVEGIINMSEAGAAEDISDDDMSTKDMIRHRTVKFYDGENYATLVRRVRGIFNSYSDLENAYIERKGNKIPLNIEEILEDKLYMSDHLVERNDKLVIPFIQHFVNVLINGEVNTVREEGAWPLRRLSTVLEGNLTAYSSTRDVI